MDSLTFRLQKVEGVANCAAADGKCYPDDYITIMVAAIDADEAAEGRAGIVHMHTDAGANPDAVWPAAGSNGTPDANGACTPIANGGTITPGPTCYTLTLNQALDESTYKINVAAVDNIILYAEHLPIEFEQSAHYLYNTANGEDVEPIEQKPDPAGKCCESQTDMFGSTADSVKATIGAFKSVVAYHDLCDYDQVPEYIEIGFHDYEASCEDHFCNMIGVRALF